MKPYFFGAVIAVVLVTVLSFKGDALAREPLPRGAMLHESIPRVEVVEEEAPIALPATAETEVFVREVIDGDTIRVEKGGEAFMVRLIGVDAPERTSTDARERCFALRAREALREWMLEKTVILESDATQETHDRFGRMLAYVLMPESKEDMNTLLLEEGYAREYTYIYPYTRQMDFRGREASAKSARHGIWGGVCG